jgi:hypothetical protein
VIVKKTILIIGIIGIVLLCAVAGFMITRKNQAVDSYPLGFVRTPENLELFPEEQKKESNIPPVEDSAPVSETLKHDPTPVPAVQGNTVGASKEKKKKPQFSPLPKIVIKERTITPAAPVDEEGAGILKLTVAPDSAVVMVDGNKVLTSEVIQGKRIKPGKHTVVVLLEGYSPFSSVLFVESNATKFASVSLKKLERGVGFVHVHSYPWAEIYIDNVYQGNTPMPKPLSFSEGDHSLVLKREGFKLHSETIHVTEGEVTRIKVQLEK